MSVSILCFYMMSTSAIAAPLNDETLNSNKTQISKKGLMSLARSFVHDLNSGFDRADNLLQKKSSHAKKKPDTDIPNGEELIFRVLVGQHKLALNFDIIAIKEESDIFISLSDFFGAADLAITVDSETGIASGWFIREEQELFLDSKNETITIMGESFPIPTDAVRIENGDIYAASYIISEWFDMRFVVEYNELAILLKTSQPLPLEEKYARQQRRNSGNNKRKTPELPFFDQPYQTYTAPFVDVNLRSSYNKPSGNKSDMKHSWSTISAGDLAKFNMKSFASGNDDTKLSNLRLTLTKESDDPELLGALKARHYSFGDTQATRLPLTGTSSQEQGIRITNNNQNEATRFDTKNFRGDAQPGWDVELHRGARVLALQTIEDDGRYSFDDIQLFIGENDFKLIFYGPQGEIQEKDENILVTADQIKSGEGFYDVSLTRNNTVTFRDNAFEEPDDGTAHLVARYDMGVGKNSSLHAGVRYREEDNNAKVYLETGISTSIKGTLINATTAYKASDNAFAIETTARRRFGRHSARGTIRLNSNKYTTGGNSANPTDRRANFNIDGPTRNFFGLKSNYGLSTNYTHSKNGQNDLKASASLGTRIGSISLNQALSYEHKEDGAGDTSEFINQSTNIRGFMGKARWRLRGNYNIQPQNELQGLFASLSYPFSQDLSGLVEVDHDRNPSKTKLTGSMQVKAKTARISPRVSVDTDKDIQASLNVQFGLGQEPYSGDVALYNTRLSSGGGVSARVFLDVNGDGKFDDGDELLPNVEVKAVQSHRSATSNDQGIAFLANIPKGRLTDIQIDAGTLEDPYWLSSYSGLSLRPRPGVVTRIDFPIVTSGEIDGTLFLQKPSLAEKFPARQFTLNLSTPEGRIVQSTQSAYDGFYIFDSVPPGAYYMTISSKDLHETKYIAPLPELLYIEPSGTTIFGKDLTLNKGLPIDYQFTVTNKQELYHKAVHPAPDSAHAEIAIGQYKSRLSMMLAWYKFKIKSNQLSHKLELVTPIAEIQRHPETHLYSLKIQPISKRTLSLQSAYKICSHITSLNMSCTVNIISNYNSVTASNRS